MLLQTASDTGAVLSFRVLFPSEMLCDELKDYGKKGELSAGSLSTIDTLAHAVKNLDKIIEGYDGEYSGRYMPWAYDDGTRSYTRRRDSMGRYSRSDLSDKLRELMNEAPDDHTRMEIKRLIDKM